MSDNVLDTGNKTVKKMIIFPEFNNMVEEEDIKK
jgi:hypothetical protein